DAAGELHEKRLDDSALIGLVPRLHDGPEAARPGAPADRERDRAKPQQRRIGDLARVQKPPGLQQAQLFLRSARREERPIEVVRPPRYGRIAGAVRRMTAEEVQPFLGEWSACAAPRQVESCSRPFMV